ncbi:helix-turn-helix domain-containing protein [Mesorhizobium australicum]|uniref:helix-turn-helix domain-containing protein n=1 Tax=Mesorhizobium australicum TaxID=536018 RepID=UPI0033372B7D
MRRRVQLITLDCAIVIAEEGSFLGASRRLGIHHSALSRRIRDLEHSLGTTLFERHQVGVRPTPAGA